MSKHHHHREEHPFNLSQYLRLLRYARPYWFRLTVGIVSGMLVGGSLFFSLMMIPQMVGIIDPQRETQAVAEPGSQQFTISTTGDAKLDQMLRQASGYAQRYRGEKSERRKERYLRRRYYGGAVFESFLRRVYERRRFF